MGACAQEVEVTPGSGTRLCVPPCVVQTVGGLSPETLPPHEPWCDLSPFLEEEEVEEALFAVSTPSGLQECGPSPHTTPMLRGQAAWPCRLRDELPPPPIAGGSLALLPAPELRLL